jgi:nucleotide-binding universal stress UspA family protein
MYKKLLVATDELTACDAPVVVAAQLAGQYKAKLLILHALESPYSAHTRHIVKHFKTGEEILGSSEYVDLVRQELTKACGEALQTYGDYEVKVTPGVPWEEILRWARSEKVDLVIVGPHSRRADEKGVVRVRGAIGSTAEGVVLHERYPVMIVNRVVPAEKLQFRQIMVCVDFSKTSGSALKFAALTAKEHNSKLVVFHMVPVPGSRTYPQEELERDIARLKEKLQGFAGDTLEAVEHEWVVWEGTSPRVEILKCARERDIELIVMGSHEKEKEDRWYVGSAVEQVSSRSICPVVVVTKPKAAEHAL